MKDEVAMISRSADATAVTWADGHLGRSLLSRSVPGGPGGH
jgi:hypothetical protein